MSELRWHPLLREWIITSTERQNRTFLPPKDYCPLCPQRPDAAPTEIPAPGYRMVAFQNKFPSLRPHPPLPAVEPTPLSPVEPAIGECEVLVYSSAHEGSLASSSVDEIEELIWVWRDRYLELGAREELKYIYFFENRGEAIGVTLHHPHGQLYAFPFIPPKLETELSSIAAHHAETGRCLVCEQVGIEREDGRRIVVEGSAFTAAVPFYTKWPYEVHVWAREHRAHLGQLSGAEVRDLAEVLKGVMSRYDALWGFPMPYMMVVKQLPTDGRSPELDHLRIEFYPPMRTAQKLKYLASVETAAGNFINDTLAEEKAAELRDALLASAASG